MHQTTKLVVLGTVALAVAPVPDAGAARTCLGERATIVGTPGDDTIHGTPGTDVIVGRRGTDDIHGHRGSDLICAGPGGYFDYDERSFEYQHLYGGTGKDTLKGGPSFDWLAGDSFADKLLGGAHRDVLYGGSGPDHLNDGAGRGELHGESGDDDLAGGRSADTLYANDRGSDTLVGGPGQDYMSMYQSGPHVRVNLRTGRVRSTLGGRDSVAEVEDVAGSAHAHNVFIGNRRDNELLVPEWQDEWKVRMVLIGRGGDDVITTGFGDDLLRGGRGDDELLDPGGNDRDVGGRGQDTLDYTTNRFVRVRANLATGRAFQGSNTDRLRSIENLRGTFENDVLEGNAKRNRINARGGEDVVRGFEGNDYLVGGSSRDRVYGGPGADRCFTAEIVASC